jgi:hypothetical protein
VVAEAALRGSGYQIKPGFAGYAKAIYKGNMKLIHAAQRFRIPWKWPAESVLPAERRVADPLVLLYDLAVDPHERTNLADRNPDVVAELLEAYARYHAPLPLPGEAERAVWDEDALATLRSLGYVH